MRFSTLFYFFQKLYLGPYDQAKTVREIFVFAKIFTKNMCRVVVDYSGTVSTTLRTPCQSTTGPCGHHVSFVPDYADTALAYNRTMQTPCQHTTGLCGHRVSLVPDYADTVSAYNRTMQTPCQRTTELQYVDTVSV